MGERFSRRRALTAGAAAAAGVAVGNVAAASPAAAATTDLRHGTFVLAAGEHSKQVTVPGGLNVTSHAWAAVQAPLPSKVGNVTTNIAVAKVDRNAGTITIEAYDTYPGGGPYNPRFWGVTIAWFVVG